MLCEHCKKRNATTHISENINGKHREMNLCSMCAEELGFGDFLGDMSFNNLLSSVFMPSIESGKQTVRCPLCGKSASEITSTGEAGCSECYRVFKNELLFPITKIHGKVRHIGKVPYGEVKDEENVISEKEKALRAAVEKQDFETAAKLRDEIKLLKGENDGE